MRTHSALRDRLGWTLPFFASAAAAAAASGGGGGGAVPSAAGQRTTARAVVRSRPSHVHALDSSRVRLVRARVYLCAKLTR